jgi:hypothetical protein
METTDRLRRLPHIALVTQKCILSSAAPALADRTGSGSTRLRQGAARVVRISDIPGGLSAAELKTFLREYGPKIVTVSG